MKEKMKEGITFSDYILKRFNDPSGVMEQKLSASFIYKKVQPNITLVELSSIDDKNVIESHLKMMSFAERKLK
jgi:hypothetical protein